jgi:hypothetical protein
VPTATAWAKAQRLSSNCLFADQTAEQNNKPNSMKPKSILILLQGSDDLAKRTLERRAVEAVILGMPAVTVQFGGCDGKVPNCLPIMPGWNYIMRLYRPRPEILKGSWKLPEAQPVP